MGVVGRETGVGIELTVLDVALVLTLLLPSEVREWGLRTPVGIWPCDEALGGRVSGGGLAVVVDVRARGRKLDGAIGPPERRRTCFSLSLSGDGESSMMRTQPEVLPTGVLFLSISRLCAFDFSAGGLSGDSDRSELDLEDEAIEEGPAFGEGKPVPRLTLPIRMRGTRVWIFCPRTSTRARISESI